MPDLNKLTSKLDKPLYFPGTTDAPSAKAGKLGKPSVLELSTHASAPGLFIIRFTGGETPDNRLSHHFLEGYLEALEFVEAVWNDKITVGEDAHTQQKQGAALITTGQTEVTSKFFSNGLDFEAAIADEHFFDTHLFRVYEKLLSFPIPTIASIGGHCFAAGWGLAAAHDYRVMNGRKGFLSMNEIFFGAQIPAGLLAAIESSVPSIQTLRQIVLQGHRFPAAEALQLGLIDHVFPSALPAGQKSSPEEASASLTLEAAVKLANKLRALAAKDAWGSNKLVLYRHQIEVLRAKNGEFTSKL